MSDMFVWLEASSPARAMRDLVWLWPTLETLHFMGLAMLIGGAGFFDLRLLGLLRTIPVAAARAFIPVAIAGLTINLVTGALFFIMAPQMYAPSVIWWVKVGFILVGTVNALLFEARFASRLLALAPGDSTPPALKAAGAVSLVSWFVVLYCGRMLPYLGAGN
jgi:hypothetical protein